MMDYEHNTTHHQHIPVGKLCSEAVISLAHQQKLVRVLAEHIAEQDGWVEDTPAGGAPVVAIIRHAEAEVARQEKSAHTGAGRDG